MLENNNTFYTTTKADAIIKIAITNLSAYNEGCLIYEWLELPATPEEIEKVYNAVKRSKHDEEFFISDYETNINGLEIGEYESIEKLNKIATTIDELDEYDRLLLEAFIENEGLDGALEKLNNNGLDGCIYYNCKNMEDVAHQVIEETGLLESMPENLRYYFDYAAYGRDLDIKGIFVKLDDCIVQIY